MRVKFCPKCHNTDIVLVAGGTVGMYECKKCGFTGAIFPEREINPIERKLK
jgi:Zn ribbon nucleic-acid-binding protein